jgi:hypothetical protein
MTRANRKNKTVATNFGDYKKEAHNWITLATGEYYPDILPQACELYKPVLVTFGRLIRSSESSAALFRQICEVSQSWMRIQLARVFRKYVSPNTPVEMLKKKTSCEKIIECFGKEFRAVQDAQKAFNSRPIPDEAICAILWEYKDRGKKGYDLTARIFKALRERFPSLTIKGPEGAGKDILLHDIFRGYPNLSRPVDFVIYDEDEKSILAIGLARYDSDRGGAQEDDRTGGYFNCAQELFMYTRLNKLRTKLIFLNDGPGLLLGSMWDDYSRLEQSQKGKIVVLTLRMISERLTLDWLRS